MTKYVRTEFSPSGMYESYQALSAEEFGVGRCCLHCPWSHGGKLLLSVFVMSKHDVKYPSYKFERQEYPDPFIVKAQNVNPSLFIPHPTLGNGTEANK